LKQFLLSFTVALPPIIVSLTLTDIQQIMKYFSSVFGFFLMIFFPCVLIIFARKRLNEIRKEPGNINKSYFQNNSFVYVIGSVGSVIAGLIIYGFFHKDSKTCVAQDIN
jgi:magnesium-transporting ATPase (P-type)